MFNKEPAVIINGLAELVRQILPLLVLVGLINLDPQKQAAWTALIGFVLLFVSTYLIRNRVVPVERANEQIQEGIDSPTGTKVSTVIARVEKKEEKENANG